MLRAVGALVWCSTPDTHADCPLPFAVSVPYPILFVLLSLAVACSTDARKQQGHAAVSNTTEQQVLSRDLSAADLTSYWTDSEALRASERFARRDYQGARDAFSELDLEGTPLESRRDLMVAICDAKLSNHERAARYFSKASNSNPALENYLHFAAARSYFFSHSHKDALEHARAVPGDSIHSADAELLIGDILRTKPDAKAIYQHYQQYLESRPTGIRRAEARFHLAHAANTLGKQKEAQEHWRTIIAQAPLSRWAEKAVAKLGAQSPLGADDLIVRGHVFYGKNRSKKSEADFAAALSDRGLSLVARCDASFHLANSVYKQRDRTRAAPLFLQALKDCEASKTADLYVKAAYQAGRSFVTLGEHTKALPYYKLIEDKHPDHSYADDARLLRAEAYAKLVDNKKVRTLLASIPNAYPKGDMATEALWRLAWLAYKAKDYKASIVWLQKQIESAPIDDRFWAEGQAQYWIARSHGKRGDTAESIAAYRQVIADYPLSYYALLALNRLRESHPKIFAQVREEIRKAPTDENTGDVQFRERDVYQSAAFARVVEFLRLGLTTSASAELRRLGFRSPPGREPLTDADKIDKAWALAFLHHSIGNYGKALWSTRWHVVDYKRHWPSGGWRQRWDIAYPPGHGELIERHAKNQGIPPELVFAFVREESGFDPMQESVANAIGLSQLIMPTAKRFAKDLDIEVNRKALQDPDTNLQIGTTFMAFLMNKWDQQISLVAPSYNAGESAVARWMRERGDWERDAFAEEIPYDETRRYSKRVIASYFTYRYLRYDEIPVFAN